MSVEKYENLLRIVTMLKGRVPHVEKFNVFTVLRSESDEVRLHSRFIGSLIDPVYHGLGRAMLEAFLRQLDVPDFPLDGAQVHIEYSGVDILVLNSRCSKAVIIENKIYAGDQYQQLRRYYDTIKQQGIQDIYVRYLTLDGHSPSKESLWGLDQELPFPLYCCASYYGHVRSWLEEAAALAVRNVNVRESIFQYKSVVDVLCGADQEGEYMTALRQVLLTGDNIKAARDIRQAYIDALVELQVCLWQEMLEMFSEQYPEMYKHISKDSVSNPHIVSAKVSDFYRKGSKYFGVFFTVPGFSERLTVGIEMENRLYVGVRMNKEDGLEERERAKMLLNSAGITGSETQWWPLWYWHGQVVNFREPDEYFLDILISKEKRLQFIAPYVAEVAKMWGVLKNSQSDLR